jgi:hypothetical protein
MDMLCCTDCFTHSFLKKEIGKAGTKNGECSFCNSKKDYPLCTPSSLIDLFQPLLDLYAEASSGQLINELLQDDWKVFSKNINEKNQLQLISRIAGLENLKSKKFTSRFVLNKAYIGKWDAFTHELKHENRFFPKNAIDTDQLSELFNYLIMPNEKNPKYVFRARINHQSKILPITEMGKPPLVDSKDGRANPKGISYFYGASDEKTAIAESRPYKSEAVCVAKFKVHKKIYLIDLRDPKRTISPFGLDDDTLSLLYREHMPFLGHLSATLSKPVLPHKKELEYLPTQYLCELIKYKKFNGIVFKSSLEKGDNCVFFDDSFLKGVKVETYIVSDTMVKSVKQRIKK